MSEFRITNKQILAKNVKRLDVFAEAVAGKALPGQFVVIVPEENAKWITLPIVEIHKRRGTIALVFDESEEEKKVFGGMHIDDLIFSIMGPFGKPAFDKRIGLVVCIATGVDIAAILPICKALKNAGNKMIGIIDSGEEKALVLENQMRLFCQKLFIATKSGSDGGKGTVVDIAKDVLTKEKVDLVYLSGGIDMLKAVSRITRDKKIKTLMHSVSNIFCGVGTCGSCRIQVSGKTVLACQKGPEFDCHQIDFDVLKIRMKALGKDMKKDSAPHSREVDKNKVLKKFFPGQFRS